MSGFKSLGLFLAILVAGMGIAIQSAKAQAAPADIRTVIADTVFTSESGKQVRLGDLRGKGVLVYFWGSWCPT